MQRGKGRHIGWVGKKTSGKEEVDKATYVDSNVESSRKKKRR
jgi:hypothetical protein